MKGFFMCKVGKKQICMRIKTKGRKLILKLIFQKKTPITEKCMRLGEL